MIQKTWSSARATDMIQLLRALVAQVPTVQQVVGRSDKISRDYKVHFISTQVPGATEGFMLEFDEANKFLVGWSVDRNEQFPADVKEFILRAFNYPLYCQQGADDGYHYWADITEAKLRAVVT